MGRKSNLIGRVRVTVVTMTDVLFRVRVVLVLPKEARPEVEVGVEIDEKTRGLCDTMSRDGLRPWNVEWE